MRLKTMPPAMNNKIHNKDITPEEDINFRTCWYGNKSTLNNTL